MSASAVVVSTLAVVAAASAVVVVCRTLKAFPVKRVLSQLADFERCLPVVAKLSLREMLLLTLYTNVSINKSRFENVLHAKPSSKGPSATLCKVAIACS